MTTTRRVELARVEPRRPRGGLVSEPFLSDSHAEDRSIEYTVQRLFFSVSQPLDKNSDVVYLCSFLRHELERKRFAQVHGITIVQNAKKGSSELNFELNLLEFSFFTFQVSSVSSSDCCILKLQPRLIKESKKGIQPRAPLLF